MILIYHKTQTLYNTIPQIIYQNIKNSQRSQNQFFQKYQKNKKQKTKTKTHNCKFTKREFGVGNGTQEPEAVNSGNDEGSVGAGNDGGGFGIYGNWGDFGPKKKKTFDI